VTRRRIEVSFRLIFQTPAHNPTPQRLAFDLPAPDAASVGGVVNNNKTHHPFTFNGVFEMDATQVCPCVLCSGGGGRQSSHMVLSRRDEQTHTMHTTHRTTSSTPWGGRSFRAR
jgi:hypothetical protein